MRAPHREFHGIRESRGDRIFNAMNILLMIAALVLTAYPLYFTTIASISDPYKVINGQIFFVPRNVTLEAYQNILKESQIWVGYRNTIFYTALGTLLHLCLTIPCAYVMSKRDLPGRGLLNAYFLFTMYFGGGLIPSYLLVKSLRLIDTPWVLIVLGAVSVYNMIVARTYFAASIPGDLYESARIDGAGELRTFFVIALPLATPILAVVGLYSAVGHWNGFFNAMIYTSKPRLQPLQLVLRNVLILNKSFEVADASSAEELAYIARRAYLVQTMKYALVFVASAPVLCAYPFVQKYFIKGVMIGSVKG